MTKKLNHNNMPVLGTPLSPLAIKVMLLGSGELGKEVIIALQRLGVETIAVDRYPNAPGMQVAHRSHVIDMNDSIELRTLIEAELPDIIVPEIESIATEILMMVEESKLATVIPTARAVNLTMNRRGIRTLATQLGLKTSPYAFASTQGELQCCIDGGIGYPCIVKPVMSSSGKGQSRINDSSTVEKAWAYSQSNGRIVNGGEVICEGVIDFDYEITLLTVRSIKDSNTITSFCEPIGHKQINGDYVESWMPQPMSPIALEAARDIAKRITDDLGGLGVFGVELFVKGDEVWFSEVSPRPHDTGMVTMCTQYQNEFELHARAILGLPIDTTMHSPGASSVIYGAIDIENVSYVGVDAALGVPNSDIRLFGKPDCHVHRRMGVALARGENIDKARRAANDCAIRVYPSAW